MKEGVSGVTGPQKTEDLEDMIHGQMSLNLVEDSLFSTLLRRRPRTLFTE